VAANTTTTQLTNISNEQMLYDELVNLLYEPSGAFGQLISYLSGDDSNNSQNL